MFYESDETLKASKQEDFAKNVYPDMLKRLVAIAEKNNGHLALGKVNFSAICCRADTLKLP